MASKGEQITNAVAVLLAGTDGVNGRVFRDRWEALARDEMPAIVVQPQSEDPQINAIPYSDRSLALSVDILISGRPLATLADPIRVDAHALLMADRTLGGLAQNITEGTAQWDAESGEIGVLRVPYRVTFRSLTTDLTQ
jgi:hypothetical protein